MSGPNQSSTLSQQLLSDGSTPITQEQAKAAKRDISHLYANNNSTTPIELLQSPASSTGSSSSLTLCTITESLKAQINSWIDNNVNNFKHLQSKVTSKELTVSKYAAYTLSSTLPQDLQIKFNGYGNYPHSITEGDREDFKDHEVDIFQSALTSIVAFRYEKLQVDLVNARKELATYSSELYQSQLALKELSFLHAHPILLKDTISHLLALFSLTKPSLSAASPLPTTTQHNNNGNKSSSNAIAASTNNNSNINKDILMSMNRLNSLLEQHCKVLDKQPSKAQHDHHQSSQTKNVSGRGRGDTPHRGRPRHASRNESPSNRRSLSRSSNHSRRSHNSNNNVRHSHNHYNQQGRSKGRGRGNQRYSFNKRYTRY